MSVQTEGRTVYRRTSVRHRLGRRDDPLHEWLAAIVLSLVLTLFLRETGVRARKS